jgi:hypothetical protein
MSTPTPPPQPSTNEPPALWNPNAAACWSLLFSPAFGAFLHARNATALGRAEEAKTNMTWVYVSLAYFGFVLISIFTPQIPDSVFRSVAIGLLLGWYFAVGKKQVLYVKESWPDGYPRKSWTKPLLAAFGGLVAFIIAVVILALIAEFTMRHS